jgi:hypothetical protein
MVLHRRRARFSLETHARCRERRHNLEDLQIHSKEADVVDLRHVLHVSRQLITHPTFQN